RTATIVFEHAVVAAVVTNKIGTDDVRVDTARGQHAEQHALVLRAGEDQVGGDHVVLQALLLAVDVADEEVERRHALHEPGLDPPTTAGPARGRRSTPGGAGAAARPRRTRRRIRSARAATPRRLPRRRALCASALTGGLENGEPERTDAQMTQFSVSGFVAGG